MASFPVPNADPTTLLAELQLSFLLFTILHNFCALEAFQSLLRLLCGSKEILLPEIGAQLTVTGRKVD